MLIFDRSSHKHVQRSLITDAQAHQTQAVNTVERSTAYYANCGFHEGEGCPPDAPQRPLHSLPVYTLRTANPPSTLTPAGMQSDPTQSRTTKGARKKRRLMVVLPVVAVCLLLAVAGVLLWYFLWHNCSCKVRCADGGRCVDFSQWCDGTPHCQGSQDEAQCFRLYGTDFVLQAYWAPSGSWKAVCFDGWSDQHGRATCMQMGYEGETYVSSTRLQDSPEVSDGYVRLQPGWTSGELVQRYLTSSDSCPDDSIISLRCIDCGSRPAVPTSRVVGGQPAQRGAWPWQVSLHAESKHLCGGSIVTPRWVITAAHCVHERPDPGKWTVYAGYLTLSEMYSASGSAVSLVISHNYNIHTDDNDIALMKLAGPLVMSDTIRPVCLPNEGLQFVPPQTCWISGWGATISGGNPSNRLNEVQVSLISRDTCNSPQVYNGQITNSMICAGDLDGGVDACQGDSGGPLVVQQGPLWWLVGDTSWGLGCAWRNKPGVYGNVTYFLGWIYEQMQNN
ncbi:transmembrane protease serine 2-like isoform X1 [Scleropages formosus]|uniref:transmembrane protease serine 2-like isoform X1 n=2 Tax=Scleropages formosus TaxID=113540 RepID=UPI0010FABAE5|nr:transmembrane protease serine 2-like isoform X1 [Scleropages formosus]XP_018586335.2 transmembrane protease serine 2-like isoform X1 [Scleropages formosus]